MTQRITRAHLEAQVATLNRMAGLPDKPYQAERDPDGHLVENVGTYVLSGAYGGYCLHQMSRGGGADNVFGMGHIKAGALAGLINAYIRGIADGRDFRARKEERSIPFTFGPPEPAFAEPTAKRQKEA